METHAQDEGPRRVSRNPARSTDIAASGQCVHAPIYGGMGSAGVGREVAGKSSQLRRWSKQDIHGRLHLIDITRHRRTFRGRNS